MEPFGRHTLAVLLAAGSGSRFAGPTHKLLTPIRLTPEGPPRPVVAHAIAAMMEAVDANDSPFVAGVVIDGAVDISDIARQHADSSISPTILPAVIHHPLWHTGQRSSVQRAIRAARERDCTQVVIGLGDQPFVSPLAWTQLARVDAAIAVATYGTATHRRRGNPVKLRSDVWEFLEIDTGDPDSGARSLMSQRPDLVVEVPCPGDDHDIDTLEDVPTWNH